MKRTTQRSTETGREKERYIMRQEENKINRHSERKRERHKDTET